MFKHISTVLLLLIISVQSFSQVQTQTVRGIVTDKATATPLPGATVVIMGVIPQMGTSTDLDGIFKLPKVPIGRHKVEITFIGYNPIAIPEVLVTSGKEVVLNVEMEELVNQIEDVVVKAHARKDKPLNQMSMISARAFNVEETRRYAGGMDDPARLATAFAGVTSGGNLQDNAIVIRGNSPRGVQWRVEGVEVPNPNHLHDCNVPGGGFVSIISSQLLATSDFLTGAFPAEYGNALAGVFDIKLRTGNNQKREYAFQAGVMGLDFAAEGPFVEGGRSSFVFNYRYSTFGLLTKLKIIPMDESPIYQDLCFKMNFPTKKAGIFTLWGIGGIDNLEQDHTDDSTKWETDWDRCSSLWDESFGATGVGHKYIFGSKAYINTSVVASGNNRKLIMNRLDDDIVERDYLDQIAQTGKITLKSFVNQKFSAKHTNRTGFIANMLSYNLDLSGTLNDDPDTYTKNVDSNGNSAHIQLYTQSKYSFSDVLSMNVGIHAEYFALNKNYTIDPRIGLSYNFLPNHSISLAYGKHSQLEDLYIYLINKDGKMPNKDLDFSHSHHIVLGYDWSINPDLRLKVEPYFQYLNNVPGIADSSFCMINFEKDFSFSQALANNNIGRNYGVDVTLERFLVKGFYYIATGTVFSSKYKADDNVWRNTRWNKGFVFNLLAGKEFKIGKNNANILGINLRLNIAGGERTTPINHEESGRIKRVIFDEKNALSQQEKTSYYCDITITYRTNRPKYSGIWALQVKNVLGVEQHDGYNYYFRTNEIKSEVNRIIVPSISYKIEF